jgi:hypothetical protein
MSDVALHVTAGTVEADTGGDVADYFALMKPRVMFLVVFTALVGLVAAPGSMHPVLAIASLICIAAGAGAAGALNMWYDADIDAAMARTAARPVPRGLVSPEEARSFGAVLAVGAVLCLGLMANWLAAALLALTIGFYVFVYTMWLKRTTPQNIVIGGAAGAVPPMIGWASATGGISVESFALPHHLHVDAAAFLGARAAPNPRLRESRRAYAAGGRRPRRHQAADPDLQPYPRPTRHGARHHRAWRHALYDRGVGARLVIRGLGDCLLP